MKSQPKFNAWSDNLFKGVVMDEFELNSTSGINAKGYKVKDDITIQVDGGKSE